MPNKTDIVRQIVTMALYRVAVSVYFFLLRLAAVYSDKARKRVRGGRAAVPYLRSHGVGEKDVIWVHCASLGEYEQAKPLLVALRRRYPARSLLLTFFSPSGYEQVQDAAPADFVCYLPDDRPGAVRRFLDAARPRLAIFVKNELWFGYLQELHRRDVPVFYVSSVFGERHYLTRPWAVSLLPLLHGVRGISLQDETSCTVLKRLGLSRVVVTGDTRVDGVLADYAAGREYDFLRVWSGQNVLVFGSIWPSDEKVFLPSLETLGASGWRFIVAPHDVGERNVQRLLRQLGDGVVRFSDLPAGRAELTSADRVVLVDTIGHLKYLYRYATVAYIGGGFLRSGIHNTLEPAVYGVPLIFGPRYEKFVEAVYFVRNGGARVLNCRQAGIARCRRQFAQAMACYSDAGQREAAGRVLHAYMNAGRGATDKILSMLEKYL